MNTRLAESPVGPVPITVVGIGADGWEGLGNAGREAIRGADLLVGSERQLIGIPDTGAERRSWPSPIGPLVDEIAGIGDRSVCVLASGDPMLHGIGATLARRVAPRRLQIVPHPSALALACARLCWPEAETELVSAVARPAEVLAPALAPGRRIVVYVGGGDGAAEVARVAAERGYGQSRLVVLEQLGGKGERIIESSASEWGRRQAAPLHAVALECAAEPTAPLLTRTPGLPDESFESDGQLTRREVRAVTLSALAPVPGQLLWDVGAGSGSVAIEWMRTHPSCRAVAIEAQPERAQRIRRNALRLGTPALDVVEDRAPAVLAGLDRPDAIFVGGGLSAEGMLERCLGARVLGGRIVANAVTLEGEAALHAAHRAHGGELVRLELARAEPLGGFSSWRPQRPVVQWTLRTEGEQG